MADIHDKLHQLLGRKGLMTGGEWRQRVERLAEERAAGTFEIEKVVPGEVVGDGDAGFYRVRQDFPLDAAHAGIAFGAVLEALPEHIALSACDDEFEAFDPATAVFIDTETTGLCGGTGTVAFLVGAGYFTEGVFRLDQCFMRDYDDEEPMLRYLDGVFAGRDTVVSYNGKSFDQPLLRTRFIANRLPFRLDGAMHLDLVHVARRFWKLRLKDCSLGNVERQVLGIERHGDVPGSEIPQMWFDYLRTRDARRMDRVFYHHQTDILSLVALTARLSQCLAEPSGTGFAHAEDRLSLVRIHFRQKRYDEVVRHGEQLLGDEAEPALRRDCLEMMALAYKRIRDWAQMEAVLVRMAEEFPHDAGTRLELAKHFEHRARNLFEAERICVEAIEYLDTRDALGRITAQEFCALDAFRRRLERIRRKLARNHGDE